MKIEFTKREYRLLLDIVFMADWVLTSHDVDAPSENDSYQMLFQKIYSCAKEMGCDDLVEEVPESNSYGLTRQYEDESEVFERIHEYDDLIFWDELIERLAERDVYNQVPEEEAQRMDAREYWKHSVPLERKYAAEFEKHGLDRLVVDES